MAIPFLSMKRLKVKSESVSHVQLFATPWTVARQASLSMEFSRQAYWSRLPFLLQGIFLTQGLNPGLLHCRQILYHLSQQGASEAYWQIADPGFEPRSVLP